MERKNGPWEIGDTKLIYKNHFIEVNEDEVIKPDGSQGRYATVKMERGVCILPVDGENNVYLTKQFRYALGGFSIESACGSIEGNEPELNAAKRELKEELGIEASKWIELGQTDLDTSIIKCPLSMFIATELKFFPARPEGTEVMETIKLSLQDAVNMVMDGSITHNPSCLIILKADKLLSGSKE
ncbi:MAG: NUDIX hydrolase [Ignavibacteria bacterium]|jgi:8-oxo-dGTP pyrophosphatase MutT (NUDIX family)|nr:NUDIX hydrolase [Ignavibacteria bacterium]MCU7504951.1 NUDIX hydrolase [Ignavibacteria bacterium]MCU7514915.1 NUDIX hydrolase [Ignavibacteria bacterium]